MNMPRKPTFYTAFSNSIQKEDYLPNLSEESAKISDLLLELVFTDAIYYIKDELFTAERLISNFSRYGDKFDIFYFSGHTRDGKLVLSDNFFGQVDTMADMINFNLKNLQCAFFNACETFELARKIVEKRLASNANPNKLVMIVSGCEVNTFLAERFATHFFTNVGKPGTFKDAFNNASNLMRFMNDKLRFREFNSYDEIKNITPDFDYAFIDINLSDHNSQPVPPSSGESQKPPPSMISVDKKTADFLAANYVKESTQTMMASNVLGNDQKGILENAFDATEKLVKGDLTKHKAKTLWKKAASIIPGVESQKDFQSFVNIYNLQNAGVLNSTTSTGSQQPTIQAIQEEIKSHT
jgi:hypothetical protein